MPFVQAKCENCGGILKVDSGLKAANCPSCGAAYVVQDAINYYNSVTNIGHIHADVVNYNSDGSAEGRIKAAEAYMKMGDYLSARKEFNKAKELTPQDYRCWWGLIRAETHEFTRICIGSDLAYLEGFSNRFVITAPDNKRNELLPKWERYYDVAKKKSSKISNLEGELRDTTEKLSNLNSNIYFNKGLLEQKDGGAHAEERAGAAFSLIGLVLGFVALGFGFIHPSYFLIIVGVVLIIPSAIKFRKNKKSLDEDKRWRRKTSEFVNNGMHELEELSGKKERLTKELWEAKNDLNYEP